MIKDVPNMRIIEDNLRFRVKRRQGAIRDEILEARSEEPGSRATERGRRPRDLLSGLLNCGHCGAGYIMISASRYGCSAARNRGTCDNRRSIARTIVEARVLNGLQHYLMQPELLSEFIRAFQDEIQKECLATLAPRTEEERRLAKVVKEIDRIVTAITEGLFHQSMKAKMDTLEAERAELEARLSATPAPEPVALHPGLSDIYARKVANLAATLNAPDTRSEAADLLRSLIDRIVLHPDADAPNGHEIELFGELVAILSFRVGELPETPKARLMGGLFGILVAGVGFEPTTFRL